MISIKSVKEIDRMKKAGEITALTHRLLEENICDGVTTGELDRIAYEFIKSHNAIPSFLNYNGFPASICSSVNDEVVHGIPGKRILADGDIVSIDIGAYINGFHGDCAKTFFVGNVSDEAKRLTEVTRQSFYEGLKFAKAGNRIGDISCAIQTFVESNGYSVVRDLIGHGIGKSLHEDPEVPNFGRAGRGARLYAGMTLAVEPMVNAGTHDVRVKNDGWTVVTLDGKLSAHYENSIAITESDPIVLTDVEN